MTTLLNPLFSKLHNEPIHLSRTPQYFGAKMPFLLRFPLTLILGISLFLSEQVVHAQSISIYASYALVNIKGGGNTFYDLNAVTGNPDFQGANLGTFNQAETLILAGTQIKTNKCNGGNVTGANIYYRVYLTSGTAGSFNSAINAPFLSNDAGTCGGDQTWEKTNNTTNVKAGLAPGTYYLEVYTEATGSPGTVYASNGGNNYKATFTVSYLFNYNFTGTTTCSDEVLSASSVAANMTATNISRTGTTCSGSITNDVFSMRNCNTTATAASPINTQYAEFTASPSSGYYLNLTDLTFSRVGTNTVPQNLKIAYSLDNFATETFTTTTTSTTSTSYTWTFASTILVPNGKTIKFRYHPYGITGADGSSSSGSTGVFKLDDVSLVGSVVTCTAPTITLGTVSAVCPSATSFSLPYTATTGSPNTYSLTTGVSALPSFVAVTNAALGSSPLSITIPATAAGTYNFNLTVTNSTTGCVSTVVPFTLTVNPIPTVTANSPTIVYGTSSVNLTATVSGTSNSGDVQFYLDDIAIGSPVTVASGVATLSYASGTIAAGPHTIKANYSGATGFCASSSDPAGNGVLTVTKRPLSISGTKVYDGTASFLVSNIVLGNTVNMDVVVLNSGASISLASSNVGTNIGFSVLSAWYLTTGQTNYNLDGPINITITKASQTITFNALSAKCSNDAPFALTATASSGLAVTYMSSNTAVATISGNTVTIVGAGSTNITASQAGNGNYFAAADVVQSLTVNASPTITGTLSICGTSGTTQLTGSATAASSNPWVSASTGVATVDNTGLVTAVSGGTSVITYTNNNGCTTTATVTVNPIPTFSYTLAGQNVGNVNNGSVDASENRTLTVCDGADVTQGSFTHSSASNLYFISSVASGGSIHVAGNPLNTADYYLTASAFNYPGTNTFSLSNPALGGSYVQTIRPFTDINGNNTYEPSVDCGGDLITVTYIVKPKPLISSQSTAGATYCQNATATALSVTATGDGLTYQWYSNAANSNSGGTLITGAISSTYTPSTATVGTTYYYCEVGGDCTPSVKSAVSGAIIINENANAGADITQAGATFNISATPSVGTWSVVSPMSFSASNIANVNSAATTVSNLPANTAITLRWTPTNGCAYDDIILNRQTLQLSVKALLAGPLSSATGKMSDALRTLNVIPTTSPYGNSETIDPSVLTTTGDNAIVDWVQVQLRSNASTVVATQAALIQRDGDIVGLDGISALEFTQSPDNYYVNVLHRNHLGVMTAAAVALSYSTTNVDFSVSTTATYGTNAQRVVGSYRALWAGDADGDKTVKYAGANNDRAAILTALGATPAILQYPVYNNADTDMNGILKYYGTRSENYPIIITVVSNGGNSTTVVTQQF